MPAPPGTRATLGIVRGTDHEAKRSHEVLSRSGMVGSSVARRSSEEAAGAAGNHAGNGGKGRKRSILWQNYNLQELTRICKKLQRSLDFYNLEGFYEVALFYVVKIRYAHTALFSCGNFFDIVFAYLERSEDAGIDYNTITD